MNKLNKILGVVGIAVALFSIWQLLLLATYVPNRHTWIDEYLGVAKMWESGATWWFFESMPDWLYLLPLSLANESNLPQVIVFYRAITLAMMYGLLLVAVAKLWRNCRQWEIAALCVAGVLALPIAWSYGLVVRPYAIGLAGVALVAVDRWKTGTTIWGAACSFFHPMTAAIVGLAALAELRPLRKLTILSAVVCVLYLPMLLALVAPQLVATWRTPLEIELWSTFTTLKTYRQNAGAFLFFDGFSYFGYAPALAIISVAVFFALVNGLRRPSSWILVGYVFFLYIMRLSEQPVFLRYLAPAAVWAWSGAAPQLLVKLKPDLRFAAAAVLAVVVCAQAWGFSKIREANHWETPAIALPDDSLKMLQRCGCAVTVNGQSMFDLQMALNAVLQTGIWLGPAVDRVGICNIEMPRHFYETLLAGMDERFAKLFDSGPSLQLPTVAVQVNAPPFGITAADFANYQVLGPQQLNLLLWDAEICPQRETSADRYHPVPTPK